MHWPEVVALAEALDQRQELSGTEVKEVIWKVMRAERGRSKSMFADELWEQSNQCLIETGNTNPGDQVLYRVPNKTDAVTATVLRAEPGDRYLVTLDPTQPFWVLGKHLEFFGQRADGESD